jgi:hypothetical protein
MADVLRGRRFIDADPPELLDYEGAELLLIGAEDDVSKGAGHSTQSAARDREYGGDL